MSAAVVVGLMSGTSLDGISAVVVRFAEEDGRIRYELLAFVQHAYTAGQRDRLAAALAGATPEGYARLDFDLGAWLADAAVAVMAESGVARADIAAIASHGHTIWHDPPRATWQAGQAAVIAERTGVPVISDFRVRDVAAGGQGAPLVPIADALLFAAPAHWRALQNLGGIGNVTIVPPSESGAGLSATKRADLAAVRAFDTGPGVCVMDAVVRARYPDRAYDEDGALARRGAAIASVVDALLEHPFFAAPPPKSTGRELFTPAYVESFIAMCKASKPGCTSADIVATAVSLTARSIALGAVPASGAFHARRVVRFADLFFDGDAKEAVAFALLGWLHLQRRAGNVPTATGARGARVLGVFTPAC